MTSRVGTLRGALTRSAIALSLIVAAGIADRVTWYAGEDSDWAAYARVGDTTLGVEWLPGERFVPYLWACDRSHAHSWHCPVPQGDQSYAHTGLSPRDPWAPVTLSVAVALAPLSSREDWTGCLVRWEETISARCPDGYTLEIKGQGE